MNTENDEDYKRVIKKLAKLDIFILITLVTGILSYYQIKEMFNTEHEITIHVSMAIGLIFAGLIFLSVRTYGKKKEMKKRQ